MHYSISTSRSLPQIAGGILFLGLFFFAPAVHSQVPSQTPIIDQSLPNSGTHQNSIAPEKSRYGHREFEKYPVHSVKVKRTGMTRTKKTRLYRQNRTAS